MYSIETLHLYGNPIVNSNPQLAKIENNQNQLKKALEQYFGVSGGSPFSSSVPSFGGGSSNLNSMGSLGGISTQSVGSLTNTSISSGSYKQNSTSSISSDRPTTAATFL